MTTGPESTDSRLTTLLRALLSALLGLLVASLVTAMGNAHVVALTIPLSVGVGWVVFRSLPLRGAIPPLRASTAALLGIVVVASLTSSLMLRSELVIAGRDGGTYANTAAFLVEGKGLFPAAIEEPFVDLDLEFRAPAFVVKPDGTFYQQFLHATPATFAVAGELFGKGAIFAVNPFIAAIGLLAMFALARRFVSEWWALLATVLLAISLPFAYYSRTTFTEIATMTLALGGVWAGHVALQERPQAAFGAGLLLGGTALARVDAWMIAIALSASLLSAKMFSDKPAIEPSARMFSGFAVLGVLSLIDLVVFSEPYLANVGRNLLLLLIVTVAIRALTFVLSEESLQKLGRLLQTTTAANVAAGLAVAFFAFMALVRPHIAERRGATVYSLEPIQLREGIPIDPQRTYGELSVSWLSWYLGIPLLVLGLAGFVGAVRKSILGRSAAIRLSTFVCAVPALIYITIPAINPDQIWAIRRFLPVVLPALIILAIVVLAFGWQRLGERVPPWALAAITAVAILPMVQITNPLFFTADRGGVGGQFSELCNRLEPAQSVLIVNGDPELPLSWLIGPPLRSWCGVSIAGVSPELAGTIGADAVIASDPDLVPGGASLSHSLQAEAWQASLTRAPYSTEVRSIELYVGFDDR